MGNQRSLAIAGALALLATVTSGHISTAQSVKRPTQDLEGLWDANTMTPLQRPAEFANKATLTLEEAAEYERTYFERAIARGVDTAFQIDFNEIYVTPPKLSDRRTGLIVDPEDGRLPPTVPAASTRSYRRSYDDPESLNLNERCLVVVGTGVMNGNVSVASPPLVPAPNFDNLLQIVQTPNTVVIASEWIHDARVVRLGGTHLPSKMRKWLGDSIGHWEGDTLVVDTTNFRAETMNQGASENLHVVERFTRINADTLRYRVTVEDTDTWVRPWTAEWSFKSTTAPVIEVACHEGNYDMENFLRGARADERAASGADGDR